MPVYPVEPHRFWLTDPFHKRASEFFACSEGCKAEAENYYARYRRELRRFSGGMIVIFTVASAISIPFGYPVFRWALPAAIGFGGVWFLRYPFANSFRRDAGGSLKISLKRSLRDGKWMGVFFVLLSLAFMCLNFWLPSVLLTP